MYETISVCANFAPHGPETCADERRGVPRDARNIKARAKTLILDFRLTKQNLHIIYIVTNGDSHEIG